jgi:Zn-dependent protease
MISISAALALLNMVPVFYLDGQWACGAFLRLWFSSTEEETLQRAGKIIYSLTSVLLASALLVSLIGLLQG